MSADKNSWVRQRAGFTMVELLIVIVIIGVMAVAIGPTFSTGSDIARVKTATRGVMQMSRYARTMAVLYQAPMALVISADGRLRVERGQGGNETPAVSVASELPDGQGSPPAEKSSGGGASYEMAELSAEKVYEQVTFTVSLDQDALEADESGVALKEEETEPEDASKEAVRISRIPYESNGRCLPFTVEIHPSGTEADGADVMTVKVDRFGVAKVQEEDD